MLSHGCYSIVCAEGLSLGYHLRMGSKKSANMLASCALNRYFCINSRLRGKNFRPEMFLKTKLPVMESRLKNFSNY